MKLVLSFLKPHWKLCTLTVFLIFIDVVGALIIPTFAAELMNEAQRGMEFNTLIITAVLMGVSALIAGGAAMGSVFAAADLTAKVGADIRDALYKKTLELAVSDFLTNAVNPALRFLSRASQAVILLIAGYWMLNGTMTIGIVQAYFQYLNMSAEPITEASFMINSLQSALASAERTFEFLDDEEEVPDGRG